MWAKTWACGQKRGQNVPMSYVVIFRSTRKLDDAPDGLFLIMIVQAIFFFCFGLNQWLQYRGVGKWTNYMFGEKTYLILSLGAKSLLAWQIFAVSLIPIAN